MKKNDFTLCFIIYAASPVSVIVALYWTLSIFTILFGIDLIVDFGDQYSVSPVSPEDVKNFRESVNKPEVYSDKDVSDIINGVREPYQKAFEKQKFHYLVLYSIAGMCIAFIIIVTVAGKDIIIKLDL